MCRFRDSCVHSGTLQMIGSLFLWILWPSFNGALAPTPDAKMRVVINTVISLCGSCIASFIVSHWVTKDDKGKKSGKFDMVCLSRATVAVLCCRMALPAFLLPVHARPMTDDTDAPDVHS